MKIPTLQEAEELIAEAERRNTGPVSQHLTRQTQGF
jgi:hypothetical protein